MTASSGTIDDSVKNGLFGTETNSMTRRTVSLTSGDLDFGKSSDYVQWERTLNRRLSEGPAGRVEGAILPDATWGTITLDNVLPRANGTCPCITGL
ncbi:hypothetical protein V6L77_00025 [Pannonibacter sp. Pt2-lr]